jgi:hypothetical protein
VFACRELIVRGIAHVLNREPLLRAAQQLVERHRAGGWHRSGRLAVTAERDRRQIAFAGGIAE